MSIKINNLTHVYNEGMPYETKALDNINIEIKQGEFVAAIGHTGSGKSTLIQHLNGLLKPKSGSIIINGVDITSNKTQMREMRKKVGLVFQYPEYQLFEETVYEDVCFGPKNLGLDEATIDRQAKEAIKNVGLDFEKVKDKSPFELSGGQKRRVAIAGVLAMKPDVLILDEPTAGLDPRGHKEILTMIKDMHEREQNTVILVSHNMTDVAQLADQVIVLENGKLIMSGTPKEVYAEADILVKIGLGLPEPMVLMRKIKEKQVDINTSILTIDEAEVEIEKYLRSKSNA